MARYISTKFDKTVALSPLNQSDKVFLPIARAYKMQGEIGAAGAEGVSIRVSPKGGELVSIQARITDKDGKPVSPSATQTNLCAAIGQLWEENGYKQYTASLEKIYKVYAGLSDEEHATPQQLAEIEKALDELLFMPAEINFEEQIEKQKGIQKKDDINYKKAYFKGAMIPAQKVMASYNDMEKLTAYTIYDMPLFYKYSHAVGQIAQVDRKLLSDMGAERVGKNKRTDPKKKKRTETEKASGNIYGGTRITNLRRYILSEITEMERRKKQMKGRPLGKNLRSISYEDMANHCGYDLTSPQTLRTLRSNVEGCLSDLVDKGHISGYEINREKQKYVGVCITL